MIPGTERWWGWWPAGTEHGHLLGLASVLNSQIHEKRLCAFIRPVPGGKGPLVKSQPEATHRIRSPEAKDGAEIKSSSVAPCGQSPAGGEGAPQVG